MKKKKKCAHKKMVALCGDCGLIMFYDDGTWRGKAYRGTKKIIVHK